MHRASSHRTGIRSPIFLKTKYKDNYNIKGTHSLASKFILRCETPRAPLFSRGHTHTVCLTVRVWHYSYSRVVTKPQTAP